MRLILCLLTLSFSLSATTYYVSNTGSDAANGTSTSTPWQTIAHVNAQTFSPGDSVLFQRGGLWRETLTVPSSGSPGSPITLGAYGSGAQPTFSGSDIVSGWAADSSSQIVQETLGSSAVGNVNFGNSATTWVALRFIPTSSYTVTQLATQMKIGSGMPFTHPVTAYVYSDNAGTPGSSLGQATATIQPTLSANYGTWYIFAFSGVPVTSGTTYWLVMNTTLDVANVAKVAVGSGGAGTGVYYGTNGTAWTVASANSGAYLETFVSSAPQANVWDATVAATPNQVLKNGSRLTQGTSKSALAEGQWFASGTTLYFYENAGNPASQGYSIEASTRNDVVNWADRNYVTASGLHLTNANLYDVDLGTTGDVSGVSISGNTIDFASSSGIHSSSTAGIIGALITGNSINYNGSNGILLQQEPNTASNVISTNSLDHNCQIYAVGGVLAENQYCGAIRIGVVGASNNVANNFISNTGYAPGGSVVGGSNPTGAGIWHDCGATQTSGVGIISGNTLSGGSYDGIRLEDCQGETVENNLVYSHANASVNSTGIDLNSYNNFHPTSGNFIYNNTLYGNYIGIMLIGSSSGTANYVVNNKVQNNIVLGSTGRALEAEYGGENDGIMGSGNAYTNNSFGPQSSTFIWWGGAFGTTFSTYASWETSTGGCGSTGCSHSIQSDPQLNNPGTLDFSLKSTSPARNAGIAITGYPFPYGAPDLGAIQYYAKAANTLAF